MIRRLLALMFAATLASVLSACAAVGSVTSAFAKSCEATHYDWLSWSPDGKHIAFQAEGPQHPAVIAVIQPDGTGLLQLASSPSGSHDIQWLADGQTLAYTDSRTIYTVTLDGRRTEFAPTDRSIVNARFSPDGQSVAYSQYGFGALGEQALLGIGLASSDGKEITDLTHALEIFGAWSPDGLRLAYVQVRGQLTFVSVMRRDGTDSSALTEGTGPLLWSPDGKWLSFIAYTGVNSIHVIRPDGTGEKPVTVDLGSVEHAWLPDSRHISFISSSPNMLKVIDITTLIPETITPVEASPRTAPSWTPDGAQVAFIGMDQSGTPDALEDITIANRDGSGQVRLTDNPGRYQCLKWPF